MAPPRCPEQMGGPYKNHRPWGLCHLLSIRYSSFRAHHTLLDPGPLSVGSSGFHVRRIIRNDPPESRTEPTRSGVVHPPATVMQWSSTARSTGWSATMSGRLIPAPERGRTDRYDGDVSRYTSACAWKNAANNAASWSEKNKWNLDLAEEAPLYQ